MKQTVTSATEHRQLPASIAAALQGIRREIRRYVVVEGVAITISVFCGLFWIVFLLDHLPIRVGSNEMPRLARAILLFVTLLTVSSALYRWVFRRAWFDFGLTGIALLVERRFPQFRDSLVTTVEAAGRATPDEINPQLLESSQRRAVREIKRINVRDLFDYRALVRAIVTAAVLLTTLVALAVFAPGTWTTAVARLYALSEKPYERKTKLELVGLDEGVITVARGDDLTVRVRADASGGSYVPDVCTIYYQTETGERGRVNMSRLGDPREGYQPFSYTGKPFKNILAGLRFDVVGYDCRLPDCQIQVVDSPQVTSVEVNYEFPAYTQLLPRSEPFFPGMQIPFGSRVIASLQTNKPMARAEILDGVRNAVLVVTPGPQVHEELLPEVARSEEGIAGNAGGDRGSAVANEADGSDDESGGLAPVWQPVAARLKESGMLSLDIGTLRDRFSREIMLIDENGLPSKTPFPFEVAPVMDQPPRIDARLSGIGSAITVNARLPIVGKVEDDYGIARAWIELRPDSEPPQQFTIVLDAKGNIDFAHDLRQQRISYEQPPQLSVGSKVQFQVFASDQFDLGDPPTPNVGQGDRYELDVVTDNQLLALLETRELGLRRRFEQIISDFRETRDSLGRVKFLEQSMSADNNDSPTATSDSNLSDEPVRADGLRSLRLTRAQQQNQRTTQEVLGIALSFDDVREELINNRVDSAERQQRLQRDISQPLKELVEQRFPVLDELLKELTQARDGDANAADLAAKSVKTADDLLYGMEQVLQKMLDLESYSELVDLVRSLIREQNEILEETKQQQKKRALDLLK